MDRDGGDGISVAEFRESVQRLGLGLSDEQTALVVGSLGADEAGEAQAFANSEDYKTMSQDDRNAKFAAMLEQHKDYEISYDSFITRLWSHVELRMSEQEAEPELSIIQKQDRERAKQEEEEAAKRAEPTAEQKAKRAEALVANRMEVLRQAVGSKRKLYGVEITSVATLFCTIDKDGSVRRHTITAQPSGLHSSER